MNRSVKRINWAANERIHFTRAREGDCYKIQIHKLDSNDTTDSPMLDRGIIVEKPTKERSARISWSSLGPQSYDTTKAFSRAVEIAASWARQLDSKFRSRHGRGELAWGNPPTDQLQSPNDAV